MVLLVAIALFFFVTATAFAGTFRSYVPVTLTSDRSGLVMETGGFLSHGAIVAREFGIPAVVNVAGILRAVQDGDRLHVDAARATVRRLD